MSEGLYQLTPEEKITIAAWNAIAESIKCNLIIQRDVFEHKYDHMSLLYSAPEDDFERGVRAALGLIREAVHVMNPL